MGLLYLVDHIGTPCDADFAISRLGVEGPVAT